MLWSHCSVSYHLHFLSLDLWHIIPSHESLARIWGNGIPSVFNVNMRSKKLNTLCIFTRFISTAPPHSLQLKRRKLGTNFALFWDKVTIGICGWQFNFEKEILEDTFFYWKLKNRVGDKKTDERKAKCKQFLRDFLLEANIEVRSRCFNSALCQTMNMSKCICSRSSSFSCL